MELDITHILEGEFIEGLCHFFVVVETDFDIACENGETDDVAIDVL
jgi:hypothetical protein